MEQKNGTPVTISNKVYKVGTCVIIADKGYQVINTMPGLKLVFFAVVSAGGKTSPKGKNMSMSFDQIEKFTALGVIVPVKETRKPGEMQAGDIVTFKEIKADDLGTDGRCPAFKVLEDRDSRVLVQDIIFHEPAEFEIIPTHVYQKSDLELMWSETTKTQKEFRVVKIDKVGKEEQIHMESASGDRIRFYAGEQAWTVKCFITGKVTRKQLEKITDVWYMFEKQMQVKLGDKVTA